MLNEPINRFVLFEKVYKQPRCINEYKSHAIYAFCDPYNYVMYIGVTTKKLKERLNWHLKDPTSQRLANWFKELSNIGQKPRIKLIENVDSNEWEDAERGWIRWFREQGDLLNTDRGGIARDKFGKLKPFIAGKYYIPRYKIVIKNGKNK
jgi:hypothetical protein